MKNKILLSCISLTAVMLGTASLAAQTATFTFTDPSSAEGDAYSPLVGDVIGGDVAINLETGEYIVTWIANPGFLFLGSSRFELILGNVELGQTVALVIDIPDLFQTGQSIVMYEGTQPALTSWQAGDTIVTAGGQPDFAAPFTSRVYALHWFFPPSSTSDYVNDSAILEGETVVIVDTDGDGIPDSEDPMPESDTSATVTLLGEETGIANLYDGLGEAGMTLADEIQLMEAEASATAKNGGDYVQMLAKSFKALVRDGIISDKERASLIRIIAKGKKG